MTGNNKLHPSLRMPGALRLLLRRLRPGCGQGLLRNQQFDCTQHAEGCACEPCIAFAKVLVRMLNPWPPVGTRKVGVSPFPSRLDSTEVRKKRS